MKRLHAALAVCILVFANVQTSVVHGCALSPGDSWYVVEAKAINNPLSDILGVSFSGNGELITLTNLGITSNLYIGSKDLDGKYPGYDESRRGYRPKEEIFGKEFEPNVLISVGDGMPKGMYVFRGGWGDGLILSDRSTSNSATIVLRDVLDSTDNYNSKQKVGDGRPLDAPIPEPDYQTMYAFYEGVRYEIPVVLNYSLKENYIPDKMSRSCTGEATALSHTASKRSHASEYGFSYLAVLVLVLIGVIIFSVARIKRPKKIALKGKTRKRKSRKIPKK